jgi:hypothetical protein
MSKQYVELGPAPAGEECAQVGTDDYSSRARLECRRHIAAIRRKMGAEPEGARLTLKRLPHEPGDYYEVVCYYDEGDERAFDYAFACQSHGPKTWEDTEPRPWSTARADDPRQQPPTDPSPANIETVRPF